MHVAAWTIFLISYGVFAFGKLPGTKVDRQGMAVIGATLMFAFRVLTPAYGVKSIDYATIVLLFAMMLIVGGLHLGGFFDAVTRLITERLRPGHLLPGIIFTGGILSAFLVNDVVCLFMAPLVVKITRQWRLAPVPYLLALATASNIGSVATITGNPQTILIGSVSRIGYLHFLAHLGPIAAIGLLIDWAVLHVSFRGAARTAVTTAVLKAVPDREFHVFPLLVAVGILAAFLAGVEPALAGAIGASALLLNRRHDAKHLFAEVDWGLLVFFLGLFLVLAGAEQSGIAQQLLGYASSHSNLENPAIYTVFTALLSNIVSNVPAVMLLKGTVHNFADPGKAWLLLAMASTLAGNLTITGSVANIIVVEKAADEGTRIEFWQYARIGAPISILTMLVGWAWLTFMRY